MMIITYANTDVIITQFILTILVKTTYLHLVDCSGKPKNLSKCLLTTNVFDVDKLYY